jgi:hypothetical protein
MKEGSFADAFNLYKNNNFKKPASNVEKAWNNYEFRDLNIQTEHTVAYFHKKAKPEDPLNLLYKRDEFFKEIVPLAKELINSFLADVVGLDIGHPIFQNREEGYLFATTNRLIPEKYTGINFNSEYDSGGMSNYNSIASINDDYGSINYENKSGKTLKIRESLTVGELLSISVHEYCHQVFFGGQIFQQEINTLQNFNLDIIEGITELMKQIILAYFDKKDIEKNYPNQVSFMFYLLQKVAENMGNKEKLNWQKALKLMVEWGSTGGTKTPFAVLCRNLKTDEFPYGFDFYDPDSSQLDNFFENNNYNQPDLSQTVKSLKEISN